MNSVARGVANSSRCKAAPALTARPHSLRGRRARVQRHPVRGPPRWRRQSTRPSPSQHPHPRPTRHKSPGGVGCDGYSVAAVVFAVDEKPQIQALDRTAPTLPMLPTTPERATHDYERNGTCDLFAALNMATGTVITDIRSTHTSADFVAFLNKVNRNVPDGLDVHVILD